MEPTLFVYLFYCKTAWFEHNKIKCSLHVNESIVRFSAGRPNDPGYVIQAIPPLMSDRTLQFSCV